MRIRTTLLPLIALTLCGCSKTDKLYESGAYDSPYFQSNYYLNEDTRDFNIESEIEESPLELGSFDGLKNLHEEDVNGLAWNYADKEKLWSYNNNLGRVDEAFKLGAISKIYDGRVRCEGLYQKSRAQLDQSGYSAKFPLMLTKASYFAFSCRGGTTLEVPLRTELKYNFVISFLTLGSKENSYVKHNFCLNDTIVNTDNQSRTNLVSFYFENPELIKNTVAMEFRWSSNDPKLEEHNLITDRKVKEKDHLALMLYEVFLGNSSWVK